MPRDLPIGNGRLLISFDAQYHLRELYFPRIGGENHTAGHPFRFGVWCNGKFGWVHDDDWERTLDYEPETMVTRVTLRSERLSLALVCNDAVDFEETVYLRRIRVENRASYRQEVRLFFHQDLRIGGLPDGDTAYYEPQHNVIVHYKGPRYFLINVRAADGSGLSDYATGMKEWEGLEGTWRDAEDGQLSKHLIAMGSADSVVAATVTLASQSATEVFYWICVGETHHEVSTLNHRVLEQTPLVRARRTADYWRAWVNKDAYSFNGLPEPIVRLYKRSLLIIRTQLDDSGAILAATDSDNIYAYIWPRDGALVAHALDMAGHNGLSLAFFRFCQPLLPRDGYFLQKFNPDGSVGSSWHPWIANGEIQLPIQEDETALVLWALWKHFDRFRDLEEIRAFYERFILQAAHFLADYIDGAHDLPRPSYDLWEQTHGIHAWTVGAIYGGLIAAANFAAVFGEDQTATRFRSVAERIRAGTERYLWREEADRFVRTITFEANDTIQIDWTLDSSLIGLVLFGMYPPDDLKIIATQKAVQERLWVKTAVGGMARFENDAYQRVRADIGAVPGNPWVICTLWTTRYQIACAQTEADLEKALPTLQWCCDHALPSGVLAEQLDPLTGAPLSVSPLTWSHAGYVATFLEYLDRLSELRRCPLCDQPLFTKESERLRHDRAHAALQALPPPQALAPSPVPAEAGNAGKKRGSGRERQPQ